VPSLPRGSLEVIEEVSTMKTTMKFGTAAVFMALAVGGTVAASAAPLPGIGQVRVESQVEYGAGSGDQVTTREQARVQDQTCVPSGSAAQVQTRTRAQDEPQTTATQHRSTDGLSTATTCTTCDPTQDRTQALDGTGDGQLQDRDRIDR
jgi:hypothetical protein